MTIPFTHFINEHLKKDEGRSRNLSLAGLILAYERWSAKSIDSTSLFTMLKKTLGSPTQGDETNPPGKIIWTGWYLTSTPIHSGIK